MAEIATVQGGIALSAKREQLALRLPYLRVANVHRDRLELREIKGIGVTPDEAERARLEPNDVLVVEGHGNRQELGRAAVWDGSIPTCLHQNHLIRVRAKRALVHPAYLCAFINSTNGRRQLFQYGKTTSGLNTISLSNVRATKVVVPPIEVQEQFATLIDGTRKVCERLEVGAVAAGDLFDSLVQRAFLGEC